MNMDIGHDSQTTCFAKFPEFPEVSSVEADYAGIKAMWIEIIIQDEISNTGTLTVVMP